MEEISSILSLWKPVPEKVRSAAPVVHCITNYVTSGICADILLAAGASPIMADELAEMEEIVSLSGALVLNLGTLNKRTISSMHAAAETAKKREIPILLDPVGAGASRLRTETALSLIAEYKPQVVRGNFSEILALAGKSSEKSRGVDADPACQADPHRIADSADLIASLASEWGTVIGVSGPIDIISDGNRCCAIGGGDEMMTKATGCGCMLSALTGALLASVPDSWTACSAAFAEMSLCGAEAGMHTRKAEEGPAAFRTKLIDLIWSFSGTKMLNTDLRYFSDAAIKLFRR